MDDIKMAEWVQWLEGCVRTLVKVQAVLGLTRLWTEAAGDGG